MKISCKRWFLDTLQPTENRRCLRLDGAEARYHITGRIAERIDLKHDSLIELTEKDAKYIKENSKRARELGMELRIPTVDEEEYIAVRTGEIVLATGCCKTFKVRGYRYCRKINH